MGIQNKVLFFVAMALAASCVSAAELINLDQSNISELKSLLKNDLTQLNRNVDAKGNVHTRYVQEFQGVPVFGYQVIKHERVRGVADVNPAYTGTYVNGLEQDVATTQATFTATQALEKAKQKYLNEHAALKAQQHEYRNEESKLVYFLDKTEKAHLAYYVNFFVDSEEGGNPARPYVIFDAVSGAVLSQWDGLTTDKVATGPGGNEKTGKRSYGSNGLDYLDVKVNTAKNSCTMQTDNVTTVHMKNRRFGNPGAYKFTCFVSNNDPKNGAFSPVNDGHYFGGVIFGLYNDWYNTRPIKTALTMRVHYGRNYENAFWDGKMMSFGDGRSTFYPLVSLDVSGHEVSHGFTEQHSGLVYQGQSGGINESFSDMAGEAAEFYMFGVQPNWTVGQDIFKQDGALRYMDNPTKDGNSIDNAKDYYDGLDVHYSSGVFNKAFVLIATSAGYDTHKAFDVMVHANTNYWQPNASFQDAAKGVFMSANDLGYDSSAVVNAFAQVGIQLS